MRNRKYDIERYLRGELSPAEMHALEKEALNDPFLAEALEGVEQAGSDNFLYDLHQINRSVRNRMRKKSRRTGKSVRMWGWTTAIAASIFLIAVSGFLVVSLLRDQAARQQAENAQPDPLPDTTATKDTLTITLPAERPVVKQKRDGLRVDQTQNPLAQAEIGTGAAEVPEANPAPENERALESAVVEEAEVEVARRSEAAREQSEVSEDERVNVAEADKTTAVESASKAAELRRATVESKKTASAETSDDALSVIGKVVDSSGQPLPGVNVMIKGTNTGTVTNVDGDFQLSLSGDSRSVVFAFIGFETQEVVVLQPVLNVTMKEDVTSLSEVVVTGYSTSGSDYSNTTFRFAEPDGGREKFRDYLSKAVRYPSEAIEKKTEGRVTVRFTVGANGELNDFEILKGIGSGCEEELIRAIKEGPAWKARARGNTPVADKVRVRYKFELP